MDGATTRSRFVLAAALAGAGHLAFDALTSRIPLASPPYLLLDHASEAFRGLLLIDRTTVLVSIAFVSAGVNGAIAGLFGAALAGAERRTLKLGLALSALWVLSGGLMILVYLSPPIGMVIGSLAAGVPRAFAVAWLLDRVLPVEVAGTAQGR